MRSVVNWQNYLTEGNFDGEINNKPSETIPGQTMSLKEILQRFVRPGDVTSAQTFTPVFLGEDTDVPDNLERMSEMDRRDLAGELRGFVAETREKLSDRAKERAKEKVKEKEKPSDSPGPSPDPTKNA